WHMFTDYPMGCGHRCTATLSPQYLDRKYLADSGGQLARSSHNTFMSLLVEQGIPGAIAYVVFLGWVAREILALRRATRNGDGSLPVLVPAIGAVLCCLIVGDMFVDYVKAEVRIWFIALPIVTLHLASRKVTAESRHG